MENFDIFILTLNNSYFDEYYTRYHKLELYMNKNNIKFIKFVGTKTPPKDTKKISSFCKYFCTKSIKGCGYSHLMIWKNINSKYALIIEDDTFVNFTKLKNIINNIMEFYEKNDVGIIKLTSSGYILKNTIKLNNNYSLKEYKYNYFLGAYIISKEKALNLYNQFKLSYHIDFNINSYNNKQYTIFPNLANQEFVTSNMINVDKKILNKLPFTLYYTLNLPLIKIPFINIIITFSIIFYLVFLMFIFRNINNNLTIIIYLFMGFLFLECFSFDK